MPITKQKNVSQIEYNIYIYMTVFHRLLLNENNKSMQKPPLLTPHKNLRTFFTCTGEAVKSEKSKISEGSQVAIMAK